MIKSAVAFLFFSLILSLNVSGQAGFNMPDNVCVNQPIQIQNTSTNGASYYWNFCPGNLSVIPVGKNLGNLGKLNGPVYSSIVKDGANYYVFISNINDGTITRLEFGNSLSNNPVATNLGNFGVLDKNIEGIDIKKDSLTGVWIGLVVWGQVDELVRLYFLDGLNSIPMVEDLGNIDNTMVFSHAIYTFYEAGNWYSFIANRENNSIIRFDYGNSLTNKPTAINLGNIGQLDNPVGFYPIKDNGNWYLFVVNRNNNSLSRLDFGNSLLNTPTGKPLGNIDGALFAPRSISLIRDCGNVYAFIINETTNDIVRLSFPNGLLSMPTGYTLGNIANFSFPHHISKLFRVGDFLFAFILNEKTSSISRLCFASCTNSSVASSDLENPPAFKYNLPGKYRVSLVVNEGLPTQSNFCKEIIVNGPSVSSVFGDTTLCSGDTLKLTTKPTFDQMYHWSGPAGYLSDSSKIRVPNTTINQTGIYSLVVSKKGCPGDSIHKSVTVMQSPVVNLGKDTIIYEGKSIVLDAANIGCIYEWNTGANSQTLPVEEPGIFSVKVTNGMCSAQDEIIIDECSSEIWLPNAFSPNNDGKNDVFNPVSQRYIRSFKLSVFNRWGQLIYTSDDAKKGWDGNINGKQGPPELILILSNIQPV